MFLGSTFSGGRAFAAYSVKEFFLHLLLYFFISFLVLVFSFYLIGGLRCYIHMPFFFFFWPLWGISLVSLLWAKVSFVLLSIFPAAFCWPYWPAWSRYWPYFAVDVVPPLHMLLWMLFPLLAHVAFILHDWGTFLGMHGSSIEGAIYLTT